MFWGLCLKVLKIYYFPFCCFTSLKTVAANAIKLQKEKSYLHSSKLKELSFETWSVSKWIFPKCSITSNYSNSLFIWKKCSLFKLLSKLLDTLEIWVVIKLYQVKLATDTKEFKTSHKLMASSLDKILPQKSVTRMCSWKNKMYGEKINWFSFTL